MSQFTVGMIEQLGGKVEELAGTEARSAVMAGSERITAKTDSAAVARWVKGAIARLDEAAPPQTAQAIMGACGAHCAAMNQAVIKRTLARRRKCASEDEFLAAEIAKPMPGTRLERHGNVLHQFYTPRSYGRGMRCFCGPVKALPENETLSPTYCHCSRGFVKTLWEAALGRPVAVDVVRSAMTGSNECEFTIALDS